MTFVHAVYTTQPSAARAVQELVNAEFSANDISVLMWDKSGVQELEVGHKTGMVAGAAIGAALGVVGGALAVSGGLVLAGPVFLALEGSLAGGVLGTLAGTLGGLGFWKEEVEFPKHAFEQGAALIGVSTDDGRIPQAAEALRRAGAREVHSSTTREAREHARAGSLPPPVPR